MSDCLFCKIAAGDIPADKVYEDDRLVAFRDINPQAPTHVLIIPRMHIPTINDITDEEHSALAGAMVAAAAKIATQEGVAEAGYRTVFNCNANGGQEVFHIHLHLLGGRKMAWPPG